MLDVRDLQPQDLAGLSPEAIAALAARMLEHIREQDTRLQEHQHQIEQRDTQIVQRDERIERQTREIEFKEAKLRKVTFELARLKNWKFGAKTEAVSAEQRRLLAGQRAAMVMSLVQSAKVCGHDPHAYLRDVLQRLPEHPASGLEDLLPHRWQSQD
jgi:uncharacterized protein (DUF3084 family)